jgi:hypothetical protein
MASKKEEIKEWVIGNYSLGKLYRRLFWNRKNNWRRHFWQSEIRNTQSHRRKSKIIL